MFKKISEKMTVDGWLVAVDKHIWESIKGNWNEGRRTEKISAIS